MQGFKIIILWCVCTWLTLAQAVTPAEQLTQRLTHIQTLSAHFKQTLLNSRGEALETNEGVMALKRPGLFYWYVKSPLEQKIVADGERLWVYDIELEQVTVQTLTNESVSRPALLLTRDPKTFIDDYSVEKLKQKDPGDWYILTPKQAEGQFTWLQLYFERGQLKRILFEDNLGGQSLIALSKLQMNQSVDADLFKFILPANVDVVQT